MGKFQRLLGKFFKAVLQESVGKRILCLLLISLISTVVMLYRCMNTNSMALTAFTYLSAFNILRLCSSFVSIWVRKQKANFSYTYGYERFEVLSVFVCTTISQLSGFFIFKESFERLIQPDEVLVDSQISMAVLGIVVNMLVNYGVDSKAFNSVSRAASSNWIQDFMFELGKSVCGTFPLLSGFLMIRVNPFILLTHLAAFIVTMETLFISYKNAYEADTIAAMLIAVMLFLTMYPLSYHCAMILMHAAPREIMTSIDKCLKEANTLDGLLEFRQEHFWSVSFNKYAGCLHVRIRRDANEQLILAQLTNQLSPYLHYVTIQIIKDDWRTSMASLSPHQQNYSNLPYPLPTRPMRSPPLSSYNNVRLPYNKESTELTKGSIGRYVYPSAAASTWKTNSFQSKHNIRDIPPPRKFTGSKIDINFE